MTSLWVYQIQGVDKKTTKIQGVAWSDVTLSVLIYVKAFVKPGQLYSLTEVVCEIFPGMVISTSSLYEITASGWSRSLLCPIDCLFN